MRRHLQLLLILALFADVAVAQDSTPKLRAVAAKPKATPEKLRRRIDFIDGSTLNDESAYLARWKALGKTILTSGDEQTTYLLVRRTESSKPEVHSRWDDIVIVRGGT